MNSRSIHTAAKVMGHEHAHSTDWFISRAMTWLAANCGGGLQVEYSDGEWWVVYQEYPGAAEQDFSGSQLDVVLCSAVLGLKIKQLTTSITGVCHE